MLYKILGALIIIAAAAIAFITLNEQGMSVIPPKKAKSQIEKACVQLTPAEQLVKLIDDDFQNLVRERQLPQAWANISTVEYRNSSELARAILGKLRPNIKRIQNGTTFLEVEILDMPDEVNPGIILQASLFDIKSKNKIFEIGRTYTMDDLNHQLPPPKKEESKTPSTNQKGQPAAQQGSQQALPQQQSAPVQQQQSPNPNPNTGGQTPTSDGQTPQNQNARPPQGAPANRGSNNGSGSTAPIGNTPTALGPHQHPKQQQAPQSPAGFQQI
ncbi:MAG TPA: hypothetical protein VF412_17075 [Bdellovibrio sp.]|uniref:hypothetical protein n=1 Tax=Bdellovibrio sp. TaxID=28201 RepID=UPI002EFF3479